MQSVAASLRAPVRRVAVRAANSAPRMGARQAFRRYTTEAPKPKSNTALYAGIGGAILLAGGAYVFLSPDSADTTAKKGAQAAKALANFTPTKADYQKVCEYPYLSVKKKQPILTRMIGVQRDC